MRSALIFFSILISYWSFSQEKNRITIVGKVVDEDTISLFNAKVTASNISESVYTNKQGVFYLKLPKQTTVFSISSIGFLPLEQELKNSEINQTNNDTLFLSFTLVTKVIEIEEVEINAQKIQLAYNRPEITVVDFAFHEKGLLLLLLEKNDYQLRLVDDNSSTLNNLLIRKKPERLFKDCFGNFHIVYEDSVSQIYEVDTKLTLFKGISKKHFQEYLMNCVAANDEVVCFQDFGLHNQSLIYYLIQKSTKNKQLIQEIKDKESGAAVDDFYKETMAEAAIVPNIMGDINLSQQQFSRKVEKKIWFYQSILSKSIYHPLIEVNDSIFIFNHLSDSAFVYSKTGKIQRTFQIIHQYQIGWKNELILDEVTHIIYAKCIRGGIVYLLEINSFNGQIEKEHMLTNHIFPSKVKIRNNVVYYLYNDPRNNRIQNMFKQRIS